MLSGGRRASRFPAGTSPSGVQGPHLNGGQAPSHAEEERSDERVRHTLPHHLDGWEKHQEAPGHRHHQPGTTKVKGHIKGFLLLLHMVHGCKYNERRPSGKSNILPLSSGHGPSL